MRLKEVMYSWCTCSRGCNHQHVWIVEPILYDMGIEQGHYWSKRHVRLMHSALHSSTFSTYVNFGAERDQPCHSLFLELPDSSQEGALGELLGNVFPCCIQKLLAAQ